MDVAQLTAQLTELLPDVEFAQNLSNEKVEQLRSRLISMESEALQKQASFDGQIADAQKFVAQHEEELAEALAEEKAQAAITAGKAEELAEAQVQSYTAQSEHDKAERSGRSEREAGESLKQAKEQHDRVSQGPLQKFLEGAAFRSEKAEAKAVQDIQEHLQAIRAEKTLVAAVEGALLMVPESRSDFDIVTIDAIKEVMLKNYEEINEQLQERAAAEREDSAEMLGLWALVDVTQEKEKSALEAHSVEEAKLKEAKAKTRILKKEATRLQAAADALRADQKLETGKAKAATDALVSLGALAEVQKRPLEDIEEPAAKRAKVEAETTSMQGTTEELPSELPSVAEEVAMDMEPKQVLAKADQVASPARARLPTQVTSPVA